MHLWPYFCVGLPCRALFLKTSEPRERPQPMAESVVVLGSAWGTVSQAFWKLAIDVSEDCRYNLENQVSFNYSFLVVGHTLTNSFYDRIRREKISFYHLPHLLNIQEMVMYDCNLWQRDHLILNTLLNNNNNKNKIAQRLYHSSHQSGAAGINGPEVYVKSNSVASENKLDHSSEHQELPCQDVSLICHLNRALSLLSDFF